MPAFDERRIAGSVAPVIGTAIRPGKPQDDNSTRRDGRFPSDGALRRMVFAVTVLAFTIMVSVAATHLHVGADPDESCAICAIFGVGKLKGPAPSVVAPVPGGVTWFPLEPQSPPSLAHNVVVVVLPPSCGPPVSA